MRLATVEIDGKSACVALGGESKAEVVMAPSGEAYADVGALLADGEAGLEAARRGGETVEYSMADLRQPILAPGAVICVGLNYATHIREMVRDLPTSPTLFSKLPRALTGPYDDIVIASAGTDTLDYEAELAFVIGRGGRDISREDAWDHVAGLTILNDVTVRSYQRRTIQWFAGKTWQDSTPVGPAVVTADEVGDLGAAELSLTVNGEERQRAPLGDLVFGVEDLVADISTFITLVPGDIIATGTPGGVGHAMDPPGYIQDGDEVVVSIDGLGSIRNRFRFES